MFRFISCIFIFLIIVSTGCDRAVVGNLIADIPVLTPIDTTMFVHTTNADLTLRRYTFTTMPLQFCFSDSTASVISYGKDYHKNIADTFYPKAMIQKSEKLLRNYASDFEYLTADPTQYQLSNSWIIEFGKRSYILSVFNKHQFSVGSLNTYFYCLIDVSDPAAISALSFINRLPEGENVPEVYNKNGHLCIVLHYYTQKGVKGYKTGTAKITQNDDNEWVVK